MGRNMRIAAFPIIVGFLTGFGLYLMKIPDLVMPRLEFLLNAIISCATTVSGFIISSVAILIGATESQIMIKIKRNGGFPELKIRYTETLVVGLFVVAYFVFLGAAVEGTNQVSRLYLSVSAGVLLSYGCCVISTGYYLLSIIGSINIDGTSSPDNTASAPTGEYR